MISTIFWGFDRAGLPLTVRELARTGEVEIAAWFGATDCCSDCTHEIRDLFRKNVPAPVDPRVVCRPEYVATVDALRADLPVYLDMISRTEQSRFATLAEHLDLLQVQAAWFIDLLIRKQVRLVVFGNLPHFGADFVLYHAAKVLGIRTTLTYQAVEPNRFHALWDLQDFGDFREMPVDANPPRCSVNWGFRKPVLVQPWNPRRKFPTASLAGRLARRAIGHRRAMPAVEIFKRYEEERHYARDLRRYSRTQVDFTRPFVYFPLHLQPELTTSTLGGRYADQLLALERVRQLLPDDWWIYAKENPKQTARQRDPEFFTRLTRVPNTLLVDRSISTYTLLEQCQFVATITGSAGWEAISAGRPALVFGQTWYQTLPGVVRYRPGLTIADVLATTYSHSDLQRAYQELMARTAPGVIDPDYRLIVPDFSDEENARQVATFVRSELRALGASTSQRRQAA